MTQASTSQEEKDATAQALVRLIAAVAVATLAWTASTPALAQAAYASADAAAQALHDAVSRHDAAALRTVLGANWKRFVPTDEVGRAEVDAFLASWKQSHKVEPDGEDSAVLAVGDKGWLLPVPIVKRSAGWQFDPVAGADFMRTRRIGGDELAAMQAVLAYFDAQKEYAQRDRDGDGVLAYARKIFSTPGRQDGLYWADTTGRGQSPLGALYGGQKAGEGYHGYHFKILEAQGPHAPGGAYDYVFGGLMRSGFALIAWPMRYGDTGVTSFMVSHDGVLYQANLGPRTDATARAMRRFDPDPAIWSKVDVP
ncbi:DUF2950 domain-containing protein [Variovorax sp. J22R133]|uniref:DUF2950 domain-containing protein n=1 Tax=Variovorax brevis TaxID=3053503 RepID=UPI0025763294|nr:DUF2950 domain-containing protein [Variovorax sp. J22R133]MDM0117943.1 DUF2950 domain-containing protein [Variovorax sp. J22R133]